MKKILYTLVITGGLAFTACSSGNNNNNTDEQIQRENDSVNKSVLEKANQMNNDSNGVHSDTIKTK